MPQETFRLSPQGVLLASIAAAFPLAGQAAPVARVDFAVGNVTAVAPTGQARPLTKGAQIEEGETVNTNTGRAQLRFVDGAYVSLQPESEFRIDRYRYAGREDGSENAALSLFKGGLRTITGFIGRTNKKNYQVTTTVATIGIRGTEYTIQYGGSISGTVGEGEIEVCNTAGCVNVTDGETYYVRDENTRPELSFKMVDLPPPPPEDPPPHFAAGENVDENGTPCALGGACGSLLTGTGEFNVGYAPGYPEVRMRTQATVTNGQLETFDDFGSTITLSGPYTSVGGDNILVWGLAADCSGGECGGPTHYVVGVPSDNFGTLSDVKGTYQLSGATPITDWGSGNVIGSLNSASMTVSFFGGGAGGSMDMNMTIKGRNWSVDQVSVFAGSGGSFGLSGGDFLQDSSYISLYGQGFFAGTNAVRAGFVYSAYGYDAIADSFFDGLGAAGLTQTSLVPDDIR